MTGPRSGLVAVLFTDLIGSTELMSRLGDRAFDELRRQHFAALNRAVAAHGGEEVKNTGDGLMAVFPSAAEAVEAAVAMQQATARQAKATPLAIRVGMAVGDATVEDGDYFGTPVVEAARLVAAARPGQILATQITRVLAGARCTAAFIDLGLLELKGLPEPVGVWEVGWEPAGSPVPMPGLLTGIGRIFVGREAEMERLTQLWKEAAAGDRRVALLAGEPGVGKSRLAAELATRVHDGGAVVLAGRCDEDLGVPYQPFVEALRHFVDHTPLEDLKERLGRYGGELVRLLPELTERVADLPPPLQSDPETERYRLFDALTGWLRAASAHDPVLLVLDDLQWAAKPTLLLLRHLLRSGHSMRLLVAGTYRDTDIGRGHPLTEFLADVRRVEGVERFPLMGLDAPGVAAFVEQAAGHDLDEEGEGLARAVWVETEGNPFFVAEVLRHLSESGAVQRREDRWVVTAKAEELGIPEGVREVVGRRLSRLSADANRVLGCASVVGLEFEPAIVQIAGGFSEDVVLSALEEAVTTRLIVETAGGSSRFAHALVRATLYDELTVGRRTTLHRKVAEAIEAIHGSALDDQLPALAHHWARASAPAADTAKVVEYATRAGDRALAQLAHDEAVTYYRQALDLLSALGGENQPVELLISLGEAQRRAGEPQHRETLLSAARLAHQRGERDALTRAVLANTRGFLFTRVGFVDREKVEMLEAAIAATADSDRRTRAKLLATLAVELLFAGDWQRCLALSDEAVSLARTLEDRETLASVLLFRFLPTHVPTLLQERLGNTAELVAAVSETSNPALAVDANLTRARTLLEVGDIEEADSCLEIADRLSAELVQPTLRHRVVYILVSRAIVAGRLRAAETLLLESRELGRGGPEADWVFAVQSVLLRLEQGSLDQNVIILLEDAARDIKSPLNQAMLAVAACETGRLTEAGEALGRQDLDRIPVNLYWLLTMAHWAAVAAHVGDRSKAQQILAVLTPFAAQAIPLVSGPTPSVAHHLGLLATAVEKYGEAEHWFGAAADIHKRLRAPAWLAGTRLEWARMLLRRRQLGDAERARELLGRALATARELGLANVERRAVELLQ